MTAKSDLPQVPLDLLLLKVAGRGPVHGYAIAQRVQHVSRDVRRLAEAVGLILRISAGGAE